VISSHFTDHWPLITGMMSMDLAFVVPLVDIPIFGAIIFFALNGFRRGILRALFSFFRIYLSFIVTALSYERLALLFQAAFDISSPLAQMICFIAVFTIFFVMVWVLVAILKKVSKPLQTSSRLSKIGGTVLGITEGILIISIVIMVIGFYSVPETQSPLESAVSYRAVKQVAPGIKHLTMELIPHPKESHSASRKDSANP
jgi:membrane protein required for colicin V production